MPLTRIGTPASVDHNSLTNLAIGDVHTQYALLAGRSGGQTLTGGTASGGNLTLQSTSNSTKGSIIFGTSVYDETNDRLGIGTANTNNKLTILTTSTSGGLVISDGNVSNKPSRRIYITDGMNNPTIAEDYRILDFGFDLDFTSSAYANLFSGIYINPSIGATNTQDWTRSPVGFSGIVADPRSRAGATGTITGVASLWARAGAHLGGTWTNYYGAYVSNPVVTAPADIINAYGLYLENITAGSTLDYSIYSNGGISYFKDNVGIGETSPDYKLDINGTFGFTPGSSVTPVDNGDVVIQATNDTTLTFKLKGSDGVIRSGTVALT